MLLVEREDRPPVRTRSFGVSPRVSHSLLAQLLLARATRRGWFYVPRARPVRHADAPILNGNVCFVSLLADMAGSDDE